MKRVHIDTEELIQLIEIILLYLLRPLLKFAALTAELKAQGTRVILLQDKRIALYLSLTVQLPGIFLTYQKPPR